MVLLILKYICGVAYVCIEGKYLITQSRHNIKSHVTCVEACTAHAFANIFNFNNVAELFQT